MFSPDAGVQNSLSLRNPRRRLRTTSEDSIATRQSNKRRKRSSLAPDTFEPPLIVQANGHAKHTNGGPREATLAQQSLREASVDTTTLAVRGRGGKKGEQRTRRDDAGQQAKNDHYLVSKEHNLPQALTQILGKEPWHGSFAPHLGFAVAVTPTQAIVWAYAPKSNTDSARVYDIKLPYQQTTRQKQDPLPLTTLVHDAGAGELALLVVMPQGKVVYWESVATAATGDTTRQKQKGLQGSIGGMFSSEHVVDLAAAEPDGFVLTSSAGRVIHLSVRDPQGRPAIVLHFLRSDANSGGGMFGSIRNVFNSSSWKRDIAAARPGRLLGKNNRQCVVANARGLVQVWELARHGTQNLKYEVDTKAQILDAICRVKPSMNNGHPDLQLLDFTYYPLEKKDENKDMYKILVLTALTGGSHTHYFLVALTITGQSTDVSVVYPITCWKETVDSNADWSTFKPRVLLPTPAHTAFIVFDRFVIMVSLLQIEETPESQLQQEALSLSEPYQDILFTNRDNFEHIVGCTVESSSKGSDEATVLLFANHFGLAKATALPASENESVAVRGSANCRSQIEQAVFFAHSQSNLFDFRYALKMGDWDKYEIQEAVLKITESIVENQSQYIPFMLPSLDEQLGRRATAINNLIKTVSRYDLSQNTRWELLWSAEKIAMSRAIFRSYDDTKNTKGPKEKLLLDELIDMIPETEKHENRPELGETDIVRHFFSYDVPRVGLLIPWAQRALDELYKEGIRGRTQQAYLTSQANNIQISGLNAAFSFRQSHAEAFGITLGMVEDGVFQGDYSSFNVEPWTSTDWTVERVKALADVARETAIHQATSPDEEDAGVSTELLTKLTLDSPKLVDLCCKVYDERVRFLASKPQEVDRAAAAQLDKIYTKVRRDLIVSLCEIGLFREALDIAEKYIDMNALAEVFTLFVAECAEEKSRPGLDDEQLEVVEQTIEENDERIAQYFKTYGSRWANAFFGLKMRTGELTALLFEYPEYNNFLTQYFRGKPELSRLSWINEVANGKYEEASNQLANTIREEKDLWPKKIGLSMAKLTLLATREQSQVDDNTLQKTVKKYDRRSAIILIQGQLDAYTQPLLKHAIDKTAAAEIATDAFGVLVQKKPFLKSLFKSHWDRLIHGKALDAEELIDVLTLISEKNKKDKPGDTFVAQRYFHALELLNLTNFDHPRKSLHLKLLWRRCLLQDDWAEFNRTEAKGASAVVGAAENTAFFQTLKLGFATGLLENLPPLPPSELFGAGTNLESLLKSRRYETTKHDLLKQLARDHASEDKALREMVEKGRLEDWWAGLVASAKEAVRSDEDKAGEENANEEQSMRQAEARVNGHAPTDGEGDIKMG